MRFSCHFQILTALAFLPFAKLGAIDFTRDIQPILKDHCYKCHSGPKAKRKIRYDNLEYFKKVIGTHESAVVIPGDPENSKMYKLASLPQTSTDAMPPPRRGLPLNSAQKALIRKWIAEGASFESQPESSSSPSSPDPNEIHTWINTEGKTLKAAFVSANNNSVKLRKEDGAEFSYPLDKLSKESQDLAKALSK
jgi:hypothetical protein